MSGKWDGRERDMDDHYNHNNSGNNNGNSNNNGWSPRHGEPPATDPKKIYSVSEAARLHKNPIGVDNKPHSITVRGVISGIQPMRKMIKGLTKTCMNCNTVFERPYNKPEFHESFVPVEHINKCTQCNTKDYLGAPEYENINAVIVELKDCDTFSEIDSLRIIVFGDDEPAYDSTRDIDKHIGETVEVTGDIFTIDISRRRSETKMVAYLYVSSLVKYLSKQDLELTAEDVKAIKRFTAMVGPDKIVDKLAEMFATPIIGYGAVKKGLLLTAASTTKDKSMKKIHSILVGDPGLAKSLLLKAAVELVPNSRYESVQFATGRSLTAIVTKEEGDVLILRVGPIPQAKGAIAALNEIGRMNHDDQGLMLDTMQEQEFTTNKLGQNFHIDAPTAIIASANPTGGSWKGGYETSPDDRVDLDTIPMIKPLMDRFDLPFVFKDSRDENVNTEYAERKSEMEGRNTPNYSTYLAKHIMYVKEKYPSPKFSYESKHMLNQFYVGIRVRFGSPRILDTIYKIARNIARLKLKDEVDASDAKETIDFYNIILQQIDKVVASPSNPRDITYNECLAVLMETAYALTIEEIFKTAPQRNPQVARYIGNLYKLDQNMRLRPVVEMLKNHSRVKIVQMKPLVLQYMAHGPSDTSSFRTNTGINEDISPSDISDVYDVTGDASVQNLGPENDQNNCTGVSDPVSYTSDTSDRDNQGNSKMLRCYYCDTKGSIFETNSESEYFRHGNQKHLNKPMYPNMATIEKYGLKKQGKRWEV